MDIEEFFCLIKLKAHFKENNKPTASSKYNRAFQIKNKQKWTPKETGHTIDIFFNFVETHVYNVKTRIPKPNLTKIDKIAKDPKAPVLHHTEDIHKENNPRRPVMSSTNCCISEITRFVDQYPQSAVK